MIKRIIILSIIYIPLITVGFYSKTISPYLLVLLSLLYIIGIIDILGDRRLNHD